MSYLPNAEAERAAMLKVLELDDVTIAIPEQLQNEANRPCRYAWTFKIQSLNA